ncbi:MAG: hypothetical protein H7259_01860 [Cytophagales bacterium]|nr:hypothetical protein [Cytophaga sp.]
MYEDKEFQMWLQDGVLHLIYKKDIIITLEVAKRIVSTRLLLQEGTSYPGIAYMNEFTVATPEARKFLAKEGYEGVVKAAVITYSKIRTVIVSMFIMFDKPLKPTRIFTNREDALKWLKAS